MGDDGFGVGYTVAVSSEASELAGTSAGAESLGLGLCSGVGVLVSLILDFGVV